MSYQMAITNTETLVTEKCCSCGINFAMPDWLQKKAKIDSKVSFYCPRGHGQHYSKSELDRTREMLEQANRRNTEFAQRIADEQEAKKKAENKLKRQTKRLHAGVCPCCNRTFQNLARHMVAKHKDQK